MFAQFLLYPLIVLIVLSPQFSSAAEDAHTMFMKGMSLEASLQTFAARSCFAKAIQIEPDNTGYKEHNAWFLNEYGFSEEAEKFFLNLVKIKPTDTIYRGLAWNQLAVGHLAESVATYREVIPDISSIFLESRALVNIRRRLSEDNAAKINKLLVHISRAPSDTSAQQELFRTYTYQGLWDDAFRIGQQIRNDDPNNLHFRWEFARMLFWSNRLEQADSEFASMAATRPDNPFILWEWAKVLSARNRLEEAGKNLERALLLAPATPEIIKDLAELHARRGDSQKSLKLTQLLLENKERPLIAALTEARCNHFLGNENKAQQLYKQILALYPANQEALWGLAEISVKTGPVYDATNAIKQLETINDSDPRIYELLEILKISNLPRITVQTDWYSNSNNYSRLNSGFDFEGSLWAGLLTKTGYTYSRFSQNGFNTINRQSVFVQAEKKIQHYLAITGRLDGNIYDNQQNHLNLRLSSTVELNSLGVVKLSYDHIDIIDTEPAFGNQFYNPVVSIGAARLKLTTNDYSVYLRQGIVKELALWGKLTYGDYSDDNLKLSSVVGVDYSPELFPNFKAYYSYFFLNYSHKALESAYFDPSDFSAHTTGMAYRVKSDRFIYGGEWNLNYLQRSGGIGNTISIFTGLDIGNTQGLHCEAKYFYQNRGENRDSFSGHYAAQQILLSYFILF
ncbi:tetratricopeptide repeat protein [Oryzomonas japonica]|uniref:Tetratricopeptide repeat protein n=1 Tax=Oryzomonas japonica TaxID=2603858 RepID=A0A7J4ZTR8_9BACT|nr:tetratricopeptide repeat protein [Oryzomonas japonica]KAB0666860.1 tetratricopeptide repeat protein [Oryzomonas japonica]